MDIFVLLIISGFAYFLPKNSRDYLNPGSTKGLKGILAIGIILHHLSQEATTGDVFTNFAYMGSYIVSMFFFLSGYGLYVQNSKSKTYLDNFFRKRLLKILVPFISIWMIYLIYRIGVNKESINFDYFIKLFTVGKTVIYNGWFIDVIILIYIFFYLSFKFVENKRVAIIINSIFIIIYIIIAIKLHYSFWWYNSVLTFILGLVWAKNKDKIDEIIDNNLFTIMISTTFLMFVFHNYDIVLIKLGLTSSYMYALAANMDNLIFTLYFTLLVKNINFENKYLLALGGISFELYMIHGLVIQYFARYYISSKVNDVIFTVIVLVVSIILAKLINFGIKKVMVK